MKASKRCGKELKSGQRLKHTVDIQGAVSPFPVGIIESTDPVGTPVEQIFNFCGRKNAVIGTLDSPLYEECHGSCSERGCSTGSGKAAIRIETAWRLYIYAHGGYVWFDVAVPGKSPAGVFIDGIGIGAAGADCDDLVTAGRNRQRGVRIRTQKTHSRRTDSCSRQPDMERTVKKAFIYYLKTPDPGRGILHADLDELTAGTEFYNLIINLDGGSIQKKSGA